MWRAFAFVALTFALIAPASAQNEPRARLLTVPEAQAMSDVFPVVALTRGISGSVVLSCDVAADGTSTCTAIEQTPSDLGFGAAAEALAADWRFEPIVSTVRVPIEFQNDSAQSLVQTGTQFVDAVDGIDPATYANADYERISAAYDALAACSWGGRLDCLPAGQTLPDVARNLSRYPESARVARLEGRALVACAIRSDRRADCALDSATDPIFGEAGLQLVNDIAAQYSQHLPPGVAFRVPVDFAMRDLDEYRRSPWSERPSGQDFARAYPSRASSQRLGGRSVMICTIRADRRIDCVADTEEPAGQGFGEAAVEVSRSFRLAPEYLGQPGYAPGDRIRVPITFRTG
jgi:TonB family protein